MTQHSATHTIGRKANSDVSVLLLHSDPDDPGHAEIARVCKYVPCYGRKGDQPEIHRQIWKDAVLRLEESCEAKALCAKLLNATVARRMIAKAECAVEAVGLPLRGRSGDFSKVSISGFRRPQETGGAGARATSLDMYRARPIEDERLSLYEFVSRLGDVPVFAGAALRPQWPPSDAYARAILLLRKPWRQASDPEKILRKPGPPSLFSFPGWANAPMALKVNVERAKAVSRARGRDWEDPTQADVTEPEDYGEEDPRIYVPPATKALREIFLYIYFLYNLTMASEVRGAAHYVFGFLYLST